jgi:ABC-type antimicrobial peptide transport system permease subunit
LYITLGLTLTFILLTVVSAASLNYTAEISSMFAPYKGKVVIIQHGSLFAEGLPLNSNINQSRLEFFWNYSKITGGAVVNVERLSSKIESDLLLGISGFGDLLTNPYLFTLGIPVSEGRLPHNHAKEVIIGKKTQAYVEGKRVRDTFPIRGLNVTIVGNLGTERLLQSHYILMYQDLFNEITGLAGNVNMLILQPHHSVSEKEVENEIELLFPSLEVLTEKERNEIAAEILEVVEQFTLLVAVVSFGVSLLFIYALTNLTLVERFREFGILKSLGHSAYSILFELVIETLIASLIASTLGTFGTISIVSLWVSMSQDKLKIINIVPIWAYILGSLSIIIIGIFGTFFGVKNIHKMRPNDLMRSQ